MKIEAGKKKVLLAVVAAVGVFLVIGIHYLFSQHAAESKKNLMPAVVTATAGKAS